jgi:hypothetical protein
MVDMTGYKIKAFNVYAKEIINNESLANKTLFSLEEFSHCFQWANAGDFEKLEAIGIYIANKICQSSLNMDFYKYSIPDIHNSPSKVSKRDYGFSFYSAAGSEFGETELLRALERHEMLPIYDEIHRLRKFARELSDVVKKTKGEDGDINSAYLSRLLWEKELRVRSL